MFGPDKCWICQQPENEKHKHTMLERWDSIITRGNNTGTVDQANSYYLQAIAEMLLDIQVNGIKVHKD